MIIKSHIVKNQYALFEPALGFLHPYVALLRYKYHVYFANIVTDGPPPFIPDDDGLPLAAIIGGAVGGVLLLVVVIIIIIYLTRNTDTSPSTTPMTKEVLVMF